MTGQSNVVLPEGEEKKRADRLLRNFIIVLLVAVVAEVLLRVFPDFLGGTPQRRWLEWLLVSLVGVCAYLLGNVAFWYHRPDAKFRAFTPWYRATAARGPIIALAILLALTNISFQAALPAGEEATEAAAGAGTEEVAAEAEEPAPEAAVEEGQEEVAAPASFSFGIDFGQASDEVLLVAAFLLGFFSRLQKELLTSIARFIFGDIYDKAYPEEKKQREEQEGQV